MPGLQLLLFLSYQGKTNKGKITPPLHPLHPPTQIRVKTFQFHF